MSSKKFALAPCPSPCSSQNASALRLRAFGNGKKKLRDINFSYRGTRSAVIKVTSAVTVLAA